jgi:hypothetical protein
MKKLLGIILSIILTLGIAGLALGSDLTTTIKVQGELQLGYLTLPDYQAPGLGEKFSSPGAYDDGAFFSDFRDMKVRLLNDLTIADGFYAQLVSQFEMYKDELSRGPEVAASAVQNFNLTYNPGPAMFMFDLKGEDILLGIKDEELLKLNVARRYAKDAEPHIYRHFEEQAKQLTVQVPLAAGRIVSVFSLEPDENGNNSGAFAGGFAEAYFGANKVAVGYQPKMMGYPHDVPEEYWVLATDFQLAPDIRLQLDYSDRDVDESGNPGIIGYWKPIDFLAVYPGTPFRFKHQINSRLYVKDFLFKLRLLKTIDSREQQQPNNNWPHDWAYWTDASYYFKPYTVGVNYRNWTFDREHPSDRPEEGNRSITEFYFKHDLNPSWRDYLKVFYRNDNSFGAVIMFSFY